MAKVPSAGNVKTRLQPFLSSEECAELSEAFLKDAFLKTKSICENVILAYSPPEKINALRLLLSSQSIYFEQTGRDLGQRMFNAFMFAFEQKTDSVVMIGTDSPTFPADYIEQAFEFLETNSDVVLGKTEDGGFYLIGLRKPEKGIFENVAWSSPQTFEQVYKNIKDLNLHLREVPSWYDVDEREDLKKLQTEIFRNHNAQRRAPETYALIQRWEKF